eukprot:5521525-Alexandrium_andersonii.AAC.1
MRLGFPSRRRAKTFGADSESARTITQNGPLGSFGINPEACQHGPRNASHGRDAITCPPFWRHPHMEKVLDFLKDGTAELDMGAYNGPSLKRT